MNIIFKVESNNGGEPIITNKQVENFIECRSELNQILRELNRYCQSVHNSQIYTIEIFYEESKKVIINGYMPKINVTNHINILIESLSTIIS
jgi:hypothetical protein